jgi:Transcription elongation factor, N-terminal
VTEKQSEYLTESQRATLETELAELEGPRRARAVQAIRTAREYGDLSENFEYHAAKNEQGLLEARIRSLRARLLDAVTIDESEVVEGAIAAGSIVELELEAGGADGGRDLERRRPGDGLAGVAARPCAGRTSGGLRGRRGGAGWHLERTNPLRPPRLSSRELPDDLALPKGHSARAAANSSEPHLRIARVTTRWPQRRARGVFVRGRGLRRGRRRVR